MINKRTGVDKLILSLFLQQSETKELFIRVGDYKAVECGYLAEFKPGEKVYTDITLKTKVSLIERADLKKIICVHVTVVDEMVQPSSVVLMDYNDFNLNNVDNACNKLAAAAEKHVLSRVSRDKYKLISGPGEIFCDLLLKAYIYHKLNNGE